jgi:hypothetical protein
VAVAAPDSPTLQEQPTRRSANCYAVVPTTPSPSRSRSGSTIDDGASAVDQVTSSQGLSPTSAAATVTFALTELLKPSPLETGG